MASFSHQRHCYSLLTITLALLFIFKDVTAAAFTFVNKCDYTVWPGILGSPKLDSTGFELQKGTSRSFQAPTGWSGRFWGRTGCNFDSSGNGGSCATADCGSNQVECNGAGASPPATLAEFTLGSGSQDFYDVSLVDGYNIPMIVEGNGGSGACATTGCVTDLNRSCPNELKVQGGGCKSACEAFGNPEYCCSGAYNSPATCKPSMYSSIFKNACPKSYSYAYDDATSTFTCTGADYTITFCPSSPSLKSASNSNSNSSPNGSETGSGSDSEPVQTDSFAASSWLAALAINGDSTRSHPCFALQYALVLAISHFLSFSCSNNCSFHVLLITKRQ